MSIPRFTSGKVGNLTFAHINEILDRLEAIESKPLDAGRNQRSTLLPFLAKIIALKSGTSNVWSFSEVSYSPARTIAGVVEVVGGRSSTRGSDTFAYPAIGDSLGANQIVVLLPMNDSAGVLVHHAVPMPTTSIVARITANTPIATGQWLYSVKVAKITSQSPWTIVDQGAVISALNGCEWNVDSGGIYGVGMRPSGGTFVRQAIKSGTVVTITNDINGFWHFSIPNGYQVNCV
jgi:hypothetical protein